MGNSPYKPFKPKPEQIALLPQESGNSINGLGEKSFRRARPVYWEDPDTLAHGQLQQWFYTQNADNAAINSARAEREEILNIQLPTQAESVQQKSATQWSKELTRFANTLDLELFGITELQPEWLFDGAKLSQKWVIMVGIAHDYDQISTAPEPTAGAEVIRQYGRGSKAAKDIAAWILERGWDGVPQAGPMSGPLLLIPPAIECGFGELGKHGSIINKDYGSSFRLAAVVTDLPLIPTRKVVYDVDDFCSRCQVCANACPTDAIQPEKTVVRGALKWYVDFDKCIPFFNEHAGCAICIAICPWSKPGRGDRIIQQLQRRKSRNANKQI